MCICIEMLKGIAGISGERKAKVGKFYMRDVLDNSIKRYKQKKEEDYRNSNLNDLLQPSIHEKTLKDLDDEVANLDTFI